MDRGTIRKILKFLTINEPAKRQKYLEKHERELTGGIIEILVNFLGGRIRGVGKRELRRIRQHAKNIRKLSRTRSLKKAKKILVQTGGWSAVLLPIISVLVGGLLDTIRQNAVYK